MTMCGQGTVTTLKDRIIKSINMRIKNSFVHHFEYKQRFFFFKLRLNLGSINVQRNYILVIFYPLFIMTVMKKRGQIPVVSVTHQAI